MVNVNLLPWREYECIYQKRMLIKMLLFSMLFSFFCLFIINYFLKRELAQYEKTMQQLATVMSSELRLAKASHNNAFRIRGLADREPTRLFFRQLFQIANIPLCFTSIKRAQHRLTLTGKARSVLDLLTLKEQWYEALHTAFKVDELKKNGQHAYLTFSCSLDIT